VRDFPKFADDLTREPKAEEREMYLQRSHERGVWLIGTTELAVEHAVWDLRFRLGYRQYFPGPTWEIVPRTRDLSITVDAIERRGMKFAFRPVDLRRLQQLFDRRRQPSADGKTLNRIAASCHYGGQPPRRRRFSHPASPTGISIGVTYSGIARRSAFRKRP
jgi:hypothetical protein